MPLRPCLVCGVLARGSYCPAHVPLSPSARNTIPRPVRAQVRRRDGGRCVRCGSTESLAVHHLVPVAKGGPNRLDNLVTLCGSCHRGAHYSHP